MAKKPTFFGGVHPVPGTHADKRLSCAKPVRRLDPPGQVIIPLLQHLGSPAKPVVQAGDAVYMGQRIGEAASFVSAHVHASVSGTVKAVRDCPHVSGGNVLSVVIENDFKDALHPDICPKETYALSPNDIVQIVRDAGLVGMGGAAFPTHVKLSPPPDKPIDTVILNGAECEPYLTTDHRIMLEHTREIVQGLLLAVRAVGAKHAVVGVEDNKPDVVQAFSGVVRDNNVRLAVLKTKYPQGAEKQLIKSVTRREVPSGGLPFEVGVIVMNAATALAVYRAVALGIPLIERVVTVTGCVKEPGNFLCRIGTPFSALVEAAGGFAEPPVKLISGGPMMGVAFYTLDLPVMKATSGLLALSGQQAERPEESNCIRCGRCVYACPVGLQPLFLNACAIRGDFDGAEKYHAMDCIECGCCSYVCPAKRYLAQSIRLAKGEILRKRKKAPG